MSKDEKFVYSYSAKQKKEIEEIRTNIFLKQKINSIKYVNLMSLPQERQLSNQL